MNYHLFTTLDYGLCNRLRGYVGAWAYAKKMKCLLHVRWTLTPACPYVIEELFEPLPNTQFVTEEESSKTTYTHTTTDHGHLTHILSKNGITPGLAPLLIASLVPLEAIRQKLEYMASEVPLSLAVGLHVRRTDHMDYTNTVGGSTADEVFWEVADQNPSCPLFLACDERTTQEAFRTRFGKRVHVVDDIPSLTETTAVRHTSGVHAVLDLYALARCGQFQGSRMSSFSAHVEYLRAAWSATPSLRTKIAPPIQTTSLVSGLEYSRVCKWSFCPRYIVRFDPSKIKKNDRVFLNLEYFAQFVDILRRSPPAHSFILITQNSDKTFTDDHARIIEPFITQIYAINTNCSHPRVKTIPIGFMDDKPSKPHTLFTSLTRTMPSKSIFVYMNFSINTNKLLRTECFECFKDKSWVKSEKDIPPEEFYKQISRSHYVLSPEGTGIDCHRVYESMYLDAIPIMKTSHLDRFYATLPVIVVNRWDAVTEEFLRDNYGVYIERLRRWKTMNPGWCNPEFWFTYSVPRSDEQTLIHTP